MTAGQTNPSGAADRVAWKPIRTARGVVRILPSPTTTPLAIAMVLLLLFASLLLHLHPADVSAVVGWTSTNVRNLHDHPVAALVSSTFVMTGSPVPNLVIVGIAFAVLERAVGPGRTLLVALAGQVVPTLLTEYGIELGARLHLLEAFATERTDVGVSYVMYAVLVAAMMSLPRPAQVVGIGLVGILVLSPFILAPGMTTTGHVLSVAVGAAVMTTFRRSAHGGGTVTDLSAPSTPVPLNRVWSGSVCYPDRLGSKLLRTSRTPDARPDRRGLTDGARRDEVVEPVLAVIE